MQSHKARLPRVGRVEHLIRKWHEEGDSEVGLAEWTVSMLNLGDHWSCHVDLDIGLILATNVIKEPLQHTILWLHYGRDLPYRHHREDALQVGLAISQGTLIDEAVAWLT